jgi:hypothetical protein
MRRPDSAREIVLPERAPTEEQLPRVEASHADDRPDRSPAGGPSFVKALEVAGAVVAPVTFLSALAYYFGWTKTNTQVAYFGIDHSVLGFSAQDYVLRSVDPLFVPLGGALLVALLVLGAHTAVVVWLKGGADRKHVRWASSACAGVSFVFFVIGIDSLFGLTRLPFHYLVGSLSPGIAAALIGYAAFLRLRLPGRPESRTTAIPRWHMASLVTLLVALIGLSLFWAASEYASELGRSRALRIHANLASLPSVTVLSKQRLLIDAPGTTEARVGSRGSAYRYRVSGLKLLIRSGGKYFMLSDGWEPSVGVAIVLVDSPDIRVELTPGGQ